jgi:hypothetical protein
MTLHENTLPGTTATGLKKLGEIQLIQQAYLAGGTSVALQLGHRISHDLDFFTDQPFNEHIITPLLEEQGLTNVELQRQTILGNFEGVSLSYFYYKYPLLSAVHMFNGIRIADLLDIAGMKIDAISTRGIRRDFIDLYAIMHARSLSLADIIELYQKKYGMQRDMVIHALRSLTYFDDAEGASHDHERPLELLQPIDWQEVKKFFREEVERTSRSLLAPGEQ